jgi:hypothetical protein
VQTIPRRRTREQLREDAAKRARRLRGLMIERAVSVAELHRCSGVAESAIRALRDGRTLHPSERTIGLLVAGFDKYERERNPKPKFSPVDAIWLLDGPPEESDE